MPNHYTRSSKKMLQAKSVDTEKISDVKPSTVKPDPNTKKVAKKGKTLTAENPSDNVKLAGLESPTDVKHVVTEPNLETPAKRSIQDDITGEIEGSGKKRCAGENGVEKHYVFSLARGGCNTLISNP